MTPAIVLLKKQRIAHTVHSYTHDPKTGSYGLEAAEKLNLLPERVFKTLLTSTESGELLVAVLPVHAHLNLKALAACAGVKKVEMADPQQAQRVTGYLVGGISALAQIYISAGRRGLEVELAAEDLLQLTQGQYADIASFNH